MFKHKILALSLLFGGFDQMQPVMAHAKNEVGKSIVVGADRRTYHVHVPEGYADKPLPLVVVLHGGLGNQLTARWDSRMSKKADADNFFVAYPNGTGRKLTQLLVWNAGACCGMASEQKIDDVKFVKSVIGQMSQDYKIDPDRIYVTGISNGGMLAYEVGRQLGDTVAAIAPVAGCMFDVTTAAQYPINVVAIHGTDDRIIPYDGGLGSVFGYKIHSLPVSDAINYWIATDHCSTPPVKQQSGPATKETYTGGLNGTEVCLYTVPHEPHAWPGGRAAWPIWRKPTRNFSATDAMCEFFWKHPKKSM